MTFARCGCQQIFLGDTALQGLEDCRDKIVAHYASVNVHIKAFDRSSEDDVDQFYAGVTEALDRIDFAVNLTSQTQESQVATGLSIPDYDRMFSIYQRGVGVYGPFLPNSVLLRHAYSVSTQAFLIERALLRHMLKQEVLDETDCRGSIVNIVELGPTASLAAYPILAIVANAIVGVSKTDACDYAQNRIRVNCIAASEVLVKKQKPELPGGVPLPRMGRPDDVANLAAWLSCPASSWLTGVVMPIDGGRSLDNIWQ